VLKQKKYCTDVLTVKGIGKMGSAGKLLDKSSYQKENIRKTY
jgi:hypothetical protein